MSDKKGFLYPKAIGPATGPRSPHQLVYDWYPSFDEVTGAEGVSHPVALPGKYDSYDTAYLEAARLNLGLERCATCGHLYQPEDLTEGVCCSCKSK